VQAKARRRGTTPEKSREFERQRQQNLYDEERRLVREHEILRQVEELDKILRR
jgi:hypothetical protein